MNILVIGNGFDIAHGLKTKYTDFLLFEETFSQIYNAQNKKETLGWEDKDDKFFVKWILDVIKNANHDDQLNEFIVEFTDMIYKNLWIDHFHEVKIEDNWVDFEKEVSRVIQSIDKSRRNISELYDRNTGTSNSIIEDYVRKAIESIDNERNRQKEYNKIKERLLKDLNRTIRALELYLSYYVDDCQLEEIKTIIPTVSDLRVDKVLNFNYTYTYEKIYGNKLNKEDIDYIHGKAKKGININTCNMVLGIDEYLLEPERNSDNFFIEFKKFYQRIFKKTGCNYKTWFGIADQYNRATRNVKTSDNNVYFYGHSMDVTDKDIISDMIRQNNAKTTVFYHDRKALGDQISNLVKILSENELIERVSGSEPTLVFKAINEECDEFEQANCQYNFRNK